jgi:two-component system sensor histidine kinase DesK
MRTRDDHPRRAKGRGSICPQGVDPKDEVIAESGITFHLWRLYQHFWLICLFFPLASLLSRPNAWVRLAVGIVALLFFAISYTWMMWPHPVNQKAQARVRSRHCIERGR